MQAGKFDVVVVGAGPAGSSAALTLAKGGARVALLDKASFPRDKACGDLLGPMAVSTLEDLGVKISGALPVGDMFVFGPTGRRVCLRCTKGRDYPGYALAIRRVEFDAAVRDAALEAGAEPVEGQAIATSHEGGVSTVVTEEGAEIQAGAVIGADGATSRIAQDAGLVDRSKVQWGFAARTYLTVGVALPTIVFWERTRWSAVPGYGWVFPSPDGGSNAGIGVGTLAERKGADAVKLLDPFLQHVEQLGLFHGELNGSSRVVGGWLKMGMVGTSPGRDTTLLVGDAAGLVNPLQGEGITQALTSGIAAAKALLENPGAPVAPYRLSLSQARLPYHRVTSAIQHALVTRPRAISAVGRLLTAPGLGRALAPAWGLYWNELLDGSAPGFGRSVAQLADVAGRAATSWTEIRRWFDGVYGESEG